MWTQMPIEVPGAPEGTFTIVSGLRWYDLEREKPRFEIEGSRTDDGFVLGFEDAAVARCDGDKTEMVGRVVIDDGANSEEEADGEGTHR